MHYLTRNEFDAVNAVQNFTPRPLNKLELVIKQLKETIEAPCITEEDRKGREVSLFEVFKNLQMVTEDKTRWEKVQDIINDHRLLGDFLDVFPYVKFEREINGGKPLNVFQEAFICGVSTADMLEAANWLTLFIDVVKRIPQNRNCFITTPATTRSLVRRYGKRNPASYYIDIQKEDYENIDRLFSLDRDVLRRVISYRLWEVLPELNRRLKTKISTSFSRGGGDLLVHIDLIEDHFSEICFLEATVTPRVNPGEDIPYNTYKFIVDKDL